MQVSMRILSDKSGFTLVENLVAIAIAATFAAAVSTLITNNARIAARTRDLAASNAFMENKVESLRSAGYLSLSDGTTDITSELPSELREPRSGAQTITTASVSVKQVALSLTYNDQGTPRTYNYITYVGELGVGQY